MQPEATNKKEQRRSRTVRGRHAAVWPLLCALCLLILPVRAAHASAAVLLEMPYGHLGTFNPTGHAAMYFDHICAETPLQLRPCRAGELGVVLSRYDGISEVDWVAIPLVPYLYGVESAKDIPATMDKLTALRVRDLYRREHLQMVAPDDASGGMPQGNWYELVGSAYDRTIYGFEVTTSAEQDASLIAYFNDRPNVTRYEGAFRNCADFTRVVMNRLYPHAIRRNYIADFGLTTPKSVARGLVRYAKHHPALELHTFRVPQVEGTLPRSTSIQGVTGSLLTRYAVPMTILSPHVTAVVLVAYIGKGRFAVPKNAPVLDVAGLEVEALRSMAAESQETAGIDPEGRPAPGFAAEPAGGVDGSMEQTEFISSPGCGACDAVPFLP